VKQFDDSLRQESEHDGNGEIHERSEKIARRVLPDLLLANELLGGEDDSEGAELPVKH